MSLSGCAEIVRRGDRDLFLAAMAAPQKNRAALFVIYALDVEVARAARISPEPMINKLRLQWWLDTLGSIAKGHPLARHDVLTPLAEMDARYCRAVGVVRGGAPGRMCAGLN